MQRLHQSFPVIYKNECFMVDPTLLYSSSQRFAQMINENNQNLQNFQLRINYDGFSVRNINNFLKICQNQQTDVQDSEVEEICLIAKLFDAEKIYNQSINFIQSKINRDYFIPNDQFNEINNNHVLILEDANKILSPHHIDFNELEFDDSCETSRKENLNNKDNNKLNDQKAKLQTNEIHSVCYQITSDNKFMKCPRYYLKEDGKTLYMAKLKENEIFIGEGDNFHIKENKTKNCARIERKVDDYNIVNTDKQKFKIKYNRNKDNKISISVVFSHQGKKLCLETKHVDSQACFKGEYNHLPRASRKNIILQNSQKKPIIIVRKMEKKLYEVECYPEMNPLVIFSIALSQIVGPVLI